MLDAIHGGDDNTVENNVLVIGSETENAIRIEHQPTAGTWGVPANNVFRKNVVYALTAVTDYWLLTSPGTFTMGPNCVFNSAVYTGVGDVAADPQFTDRANGNWRLKLGSPAFALGFVDLKYELIGVDGIAMGPPGTATGGGGGNPVPNPSYPADKGGFLVRGNQIVDGALKPVRFTGANLNGAEWNDAADTFGLLPGGYTARNYKAVLDDIKGLGFNLIRLPLSDSTIVSTRTRHGYAEGPNPEFIGKRPIDIIGMTCQYARQIGLYILLDHHRNNALTGYGTQVNFLAGDGFTLTDIINNWKTLVTHPDILGNPAVMGCDIHNEPNGRAFDWNVWAPQAEQIANAIHSVNPNVLALIEGNEISYSQGGEAWGWWGGNLRDFDTRRLDGALTSYIEVAHADLALGTGDGAVEVIYRPDALTAGATLFDLRNDAGANGIACGIDATDLRLLDGTTDRGGGAHPALGKAQYAALARIGGTVRGYAGLTSATTAGFLFAILATTDCSTGRIRIGAGLRGLVLGVRLSKRTGRGMLFGSVPVLAKFPVL